MCNHYESKEELLSDLEKYGGVHAIIEAQESGNFDKVNQILELSKKIKNGYEFLVKSYIENNDLTDQIKFIKNNVGFKPIYEEQIIYFFHIADNEEKFNKLLGLAGLHFNYYQMVTEYTNIGGINYNEFKKRLFNLKQITWEPESEKDIFDTALGLKDYLLRKGIIKRTNADDFNKEELNKDNIDKRVDKYIEEHGQEILEFLGKNGKILVVMNSAEKFADRVIEKLDIEKKLVVKIPVQTYENGKSTGKSIDDKTKEKLLKDFGDSKNILILEDMIDSGNLLKLLEEYLIKKGKNLRIVCLLDKQNPESKVVKKKLKTIMTSIIKIPNEFIIGYGIDYYLRLLAGLDGLYTVEDQKRFLEIMEIYINKIKILAEIELVKSNISNV